MQAKVDSLLAKVNSHNINNENRDLLEIELYEKKGLQIMTRTDKKKSFYPHISDNTKFLFAYYLYQETMNIQGNILLFDEPSNGFHVTAQEFLLNFLQSLAASGNLVIITTHSEHLIDPDRLSGIRIMTTDDDESITVKNHFYNQPTGKGDYVALQPILDAIGFKYSKQINIKDKVIITEGVTDMLYLRAFNTILKHEGELSIAPARSDSHILSLIPLLISQDIKFKVVIDTSNIKNLIRISYDINDDFIWEVPIPSLFKEKMTGSGIEDLFTKEDFKKLLVAMGQTIRENYEQIGNSSYIKNDPFKRLLASNLYENSKKYQEDYFEPQTIENFRKALDFCKNDTWFRV